MAGEISFKLQGAGGLKKEIIAYSGLSIGAPSIAYQQPGTLVIGDGSSAGLPDCIVIGYKNNVPFYNTTITTTTISIGNNTSYQVGYPVSGSVLLGTNNTVSNSTCIVIGNGLTSNGYGNSNNVLIGNSANGSGSSAICLGYNTTTGSNYSGGIAIGAAASAAGSYGLSLGYAANSGTSGSQCISLGYAASCNYSNANYSISLGASSTSQNTYTISIGYSCGVSGVGGLGIGYAQTIAGANAVGIGGSCIAAAQSCLAVGYGALAYGSYDTVIGASAQTGASSGGYNVVLGQNATTGTSTTGAVSIGTHAGSTGNYSTSINPASSAQSATLYGQTQLGFYPAVGSGSAAFKNSIVTAGNQTTNATPTVLFLDYGATQHITLQNNSITHFRAKVVAKVSGAAVDASVWEIVGSIQKGTTAASSVLLGTPTTTVIGQTSGAVSGSWAIAVSANTTAGSLDFTATGAASTTIVWYVSVEMKELTF